MISEKMRILISLIRNGAVIYGAGRNGEEAFSILSNYSINVVAVVDQHKQGMWKGFNIIKPEKIRVEEDIKKCVFIITIDTNKNDIYEKYKGKFSTIIGMDYIRRLKYTFPDDQGDGFTYIQSYPFNHYESPFMPRQDFQLWQKTISNGDLDDIDTSQEIQLSFWNRMCDLTNDFFAMISDSIDTRYKKNNQMFCCCDALALYRMIIDYQPERIIEIGSGWSTCLMLDAFDRLKKKTSISCIDPFPERLYESIRDSDRDAIEVEENYVQSIPLSFFQD